MRRLVIVVALVGALTATAAALAAGSSPIAEKVLGAGGISDGYTINVKKPGDVVVAEATVPPGASFGWHSHRAPVVVVVKSGTLTLYDSSDKACAPERYATGASSTASTPTRRSRAQGTVPSRPRGLRPPAPEEPRRPSPGLFGRRKR